MSETRVLKIRMMGGFSCSWGKKVLSFTGSTGSKTTRLLIYLLYSYPAEQSRSNVMEVLYEDSEGNSSNSLKTLLLRLRRQLAAELALPENDCIILSGGKLRFSDSIRVESDVQEFSGLIRTALSSNSEKTREELLQRGCRLYQGELLPPLSTDSWVIYENKALTELYARATRELLRIYRGNGEYNKAYECCQLARLTFPFDEGWMSDCIEMLILLGRYRQAMTEYEMMTQLLFEEFGIMPSERLRNLQRSLNKLLSEKASEQKRIGQVLEEDQGFGAYYCSYQNFVSSCKVLMRIARREGSRRLLLLLVTAVDRSDKPLTDSRVLQRVMPLLSRTISRTLRKSDMYTRISPCEMLILLWGASEEQADTVEARLSRAFRESGEAEELYLRCTVVSNGEQQEEENLRQYRKP